MGSLLMSTVITLSIRVKLYKTSVKTLKKTCPKSAISCLDPAIDRMYLRHTSTTHNMISGITIGAEPANVRSGFADDPNKRLYEICDEDNGHIISQKMANSHTFQRFTILWARASAGNIKQPNALPSLYKASFFQEAAQYCITGPTQTRLLLDSLEHYGEYFEQKPPTGEVKYFAQWQLGLAREKMGVEWAQVEETLLHASNFHPKRGEAMKHVIQHYRESREFGLAYIYSSIAKQQYYAQVPEDLEWFGDDSFYRWKILNYHVSICSKIGDMAEAKVTFEELWSFSQAHPEYFTDEQMQSLYKSKKAFQS